MKNNIQYLAIIFLYFLITSNVSAFKFEAKDIKILEKENILYAFEGKAISLDNEIEIYADKFEFNKSSEILKSSGNGLAKFKTKNLQIKFEKSNFDKKNQILIANKNVIIENINSLLQIKTDQIQYEKKREIISSKVQTYFYDKNKNEYIVESFTYEINKDLLKLKNLIINDVYGNTTSTDLAYINTKTGRIIGKDLFSVLNRELFDKENIPRLRGNSFDFINNSKTINKGVFTTCKIKKDGCPPWKITSKKIHHDTKKKTLNYEDAFLHIYDVPVIYFPKFFHPDPTVKRQSGFLVPSINSSNTDNFLNIPYFLAISESKDATFSPRFFLNDKILMQTEYRQINLNSKHNVDFSFLTKKTKHQKNHLFYNYESNLNFENYISSNIELNLQKTSNDTYLKKNKLKSPLINDANVLENYLKMNLSKEDSILEINSYIYEDLTKNNNDRYEYIFPEINFQKKLVNNTQLRGEFNLDSNIFTKNYNTNIHEKVNINDLKFSSYPKITSKGFYNNYEILIRNSNTDNQNSSNYKNDENFYLSSLFQFNSSYPLIKKNKKIEKILNPKLALKIAPDHTKNQTNDEYVIDVNNIYSLNRTTSADVIEGGISLVVGSDYEILDNSNSRKILNLKIANNIRYKENLKLPKNNQLGEKTSNFFSQIEYAPFNALKLNYKSSVKNNLNSINYENLITELSFNKLVMTFDYLNENDTTDKNSYLTNETTYLLNDSNSLSFNTRKNKKDDLTEYYNLMYKYKNDCLTASIEYNKDFYSDRDIKPKENLFFKITIIPLGETSGPNLLK